MDRRRRFGGVGEFVYGCMWVCICVCRSNRVDDTGLYKTAGKSIIMKMHKGNKTVDGRRSEKRKRRGGGKEKERNRRDKQRKEKTGRRHWLRSTVAEGQDFPRPAA